MKRTLLVLTFVLTASIAFSQNHYFLNSNPSPKGLLAYSNQNTYKYDKSIIGSYDKTIANSLFIPFTLKKSLFYKQPITTEKNLQTTDNMPCLKPEGYYPAKIVSPDSSIKYSILIKQL